MRLTGGEIERYWRDGILVVRGMMSAAEAASVRDHFTDLRRRALDPDSPLRAHYRPLPPEQAGSDGLKSYPRVMQPHRFDEVGMRVMLRPCIGAVLSDLFGEQPLAAASMVYFKPPGARGQALHQDNFFLRARPAPCVAAWVALDDADADNGALVVVPGSHQGGLLCPHAADLRRSFTTEEVDVPPGRAPEVVSVRAGDTVFLHGAVIHGSYPNTTHDRFRRAFIGHYVPASTLAMNSGHYPLHTFRGERVERGHAPGGGPCGTEEWQAFRAGVDSQLRELGRAGTQPEVRLGEFYLTNFHRPIEAMPPAPIVPPVARA